MSSMLDYCSAPVMPVGLQVLPEEGVEDETLPDIAGMPAGKAGNSMETSCYGNIMGMSTSPPS